MKSLILALLLASPFASLVAQVITQSAELPAPGRFGAVTFVIDSFAYAGLGETGSEQYPTQFFKYNSTTDEWSQIASFPGSGREHAVAFTLNGQGYVGLGFSFAGVDFTFHKDFFRYDPLADEWTAVADFGGEARVKAVAFVVDSTAYAGTGSNAGVLLNDFWKYDEESDIWVPVASLGNITPRQGAASAVVDGKAYLIGGRGDAGVFSEDILEFDPSAGDTWTVKRSIPGLQLESGAAFELNHQIYFGYGGNASGLHLYDPVENNATAFGQLPDLKSIDRGPIAFAIDSVTAFFGLGYSSVVANQPASYRKELWKLEVEIVSSVQYAQPGLSAKIIPAGPSVYRVLSDIREACGIMVYGLNAMPVYCREQVFPGEVFSLDIPTGIYCVAIQSTSGNVASQLLFHRSDN